jgi:RNA polymerase sigma-70 factor (ECF subfamily)
MTVWDDEAQLAADFAAGRPTGLDRAYERYGRDLYAVARHVVGREGAEDCVHDALLRVWQRRGAYRPERGTLRAFLIVCVRNEALAVLRGSQRRSAREARANLLDASAPETIELVDFVEARRVRDALTRLPQEQRTALERAYYRSETHSEIAANLGIPLGTVKSRLALGLRRLATELTAQGSAS